MKRSYHSTVLPMQDARATLRSMAGEGVSSALSPSRCGLGFLPSPLFPFSLSRPRGLLGRNLGALTDYALADAGGPPLLWNALSCRNSCGFGHTGKPRILATAVMTPRISARPLSRPIAE